MYNINKNMSKKWFTNGVIQVLAESCPEGFKPGRLPVSDETRKKHSENNAWKKSILNRKDERVIPLLGIYFGKKRLRMKSKYGKRLFLIPVNMCGRK